LTTMALKITEKCPKINCYGTQPSYAIPPSPTLSMNPFGKALP